MQTHLRQEVILWRYILWKTKTDPLSANVGSRIGLRLIHIPSRRIQIFMKGLNYLVPVKWEEIIVIMLSSASFFYGASNFIINGGTFSINRSDSNAVLRQTGEWIRSSLSEWKMFMASLNMHRITWKLHRCSSIACCMFPSNLYSLGSQLKTGPEAARKSYTNNRQKIGENRRGYARDDELTSNFYRLAADD